MADRFVFFTLASVFLIFLSIFRFLFCQFSTSAFSSFLERFVRRFEEGFSVDDVTATDVFFSTLFLRVFDATFGMVCLDGLRGVTQNIEAV